MAQTLLLVDDVEDNRRTFSTVLARSGYDVVVASDGREAVAQAKLHAPDLILMDLQMPVMDGWEAARVLKADPATASIPIIALTACDPASLHLEEAGFCAHVPKPVLCRPLVHAVDACLHRAPEGGHGCGTDPLGTRFPCCRSGGGR
jgi:CheY-like chemotaxis protein